MRVGKRIFVSGSSSERIVVVRPLLRALEDYGYTITYDWTCNPGYELERELTRDEQREVARRNIEGLRAADTYWYVAPGVRSEGSHAELGMAVILEKGVVTSGRHAHGLGRVFTMLADRHFHMHSEALEFFRLEAVAGAVNE